MIENLKVKSESELEQENAIEDIKKEYAEKEKLKPLTTSERFDRIEKILGIK